MTFSSPEFLFVFLPLTLAGFGLLTRLDDPRYGACWLGAATLVFFAWNQGYGVIWLLASISANFGFSIWLQARPVKQRAPVLVIALAANLAFLGIFKYSVPAAAAIDAGLGTETAVLAVPLLLGVSFFTFQQITYLIQVKQGHITDRRFWLYFLFVSFFPYIISGPIARFGEVAGQFERPRRLGVLNLQVGFTLFAIGLFKKVIVAEQLGQIVDPVFTAADHSLSLWDGWAGALAFTFQVYFDLSGYTDMALGLARMVGVRLPINFLSPYKAVNIGDFWNRWHMTMTRFFTDFIYNPLAMTLTRRSMRYSQRALVIFGLTVLTPTVITMVLIGFWHQAGLTFILFGVMHGLALSVYQAWKKWRPFILPGPIAWGLTFLFLVTTLVLFRAPDIASAMGVWQAMIGQTVITIPASLASVLALQNIEQLLGFSVQVGDFFTVATVGAARVVLCILGALVFCLCLPNTDQLLRRYSPGLKSRQRPTPTLWGNQLAWRATPIWSLLFGALLGGTVVKMLSTDLSSFIYFQF